MAYIHYDTKSNGVVYASVYESYREGGKVKTKRLDTLGRVIDKERGIFSKSGKQFVYTVKEGRASLPDDYNPESVIPERENLILDFGDTFFVEQYLENQPFYNVIRETLPEENDTLIALVLYRILTSKQSNWHAKAWYEGNYAYLSYPRANLTSQNITRVLTKLGNEGLQRDFFERYLACVYNSHDAAGILVDSTGVPNATKMDITQISNHNGDISREVRVIYVLDRNSGMPIYFRYVAGNIIDVSTLITTVSEIQQYGVQINYAILDAGYFSEKNADELFKNNIPFITRVAPNKSVFKDNVSLHLDGLMSQKYAFRYGERLVYIKKIPVTVCDHHAYLYLCMDEDVYLMNHKKTVLNGLENNYDIETTDAALKRLGLFALLSSEELKEEELLPVYYTRQQVEQVFDITKNYADLLPIRVQSEEAFAGHLLVCFIATIILQKIQHDLKLKRSKKSKELNSESIWGYLRNQKCKVYKDYAIPQEARKEVNAIYDIFKINCPYKIPLTSIDV
jgi:hypothetical protein